MLVLGEFGDVGVGLESLLGLGLGLLGFGERDNAESCCVCGVV